MVKSRGLLVSQLFVLLLVGESLAMFSKSKPKPKVDDLEAVCKDQEIELTQLSEFYSLTEKLDNPELECPKNTRDALGQMRDVISRDTYSVCSMQKAQAIEEFYLRFLERSSDQQQLAPPLPKSLKKFFLAYAMQVVNTCKLNMIQVFLDEGIKLKNLGDFHQLKEWTQENSPVGKLLQVLAEKGEIYTPQDLQAALPSGGEMPTKQLIIETQRSAPTERIQAICLRRFRPVYWPLVEPLALLTRLGFDYKDNFLRADLREPVLVRAIEEWSRIVFFCEAMLSVTVQQSVADRESEIRQENSNSEIQEEAPNSDIELFEWEQRRVSLDNSILTDCDKNKMKRLIKNFDENKSNFERSKRRLLVEGWNLLRVYFKYGDYREIFDKIRWNGRKFSEVENGDLVNLLKLECKNQTKISKVFSRLAEVDRKVRNTAALPFAFMNMLYMSVAYNVVDKLSPTKQTG